MLIVASVFDPGIGFCDIRGCGEGDSGSGGDAVLPASLEALGSQVASSFAMERLWMRRRQVTSISEMPARTRTRNV